MSYITPVYSFKDLVGSLTHPLMQPYTFAGEDGIGKVTVTMETVRTTFNVAADGTVMPSAVPGDISTVEIEMQQNSKLNDWLLEWSNRLYTAQRVGDVSTWSSMVASLNNIVSGSSHYCRGGSPKLQPAKSYGAEAVMLTWTLMFADTVNG